MTDRTGTATIAIEQSVRIAASPETVWAFWTDPARLVRWWGVDAEVVAEPGGLFRVVMESGPVMRGEFVELEPPHRLVFTFGWEQHGEGEPLAPGSTRVEVSISAEAGGCLLVLRHADMPQSHAADHRMGWSHILGERLVSAVAAEAA